MKYHARLVKMAKAYFRKERKEAESHLKLVERTLADPKCKDPRGEYFRYPEGTKYAGDYCGPDVAERLRKFLKNLPEEERSWLDRIERASKAEVVESIHVSVDWKRSRTWGSNPSAEVWVNTKSDIAHTESGSIGGCGFDKESTAVSRALSRVGGAVRAALDRLVFEGGPKAWKEYAVDKTPVPHLSFGAKGMSTFTCLFPRIGSRKEWRRDHAFPKYVIEADTRGSTHNSYHVWLRSKV